MRWKDVPDRDPPSASRYLRHARRKLDVRVGQTGFEALLYS